MWYFLLGLSLTLPQAACSLGCHGRFARPVRFGRSHVCVQARPWVRIDNRASGPQIMAARPGSWPGPGKAGRVADAERTRNRASAADSDVAGEPSAAAQVPRPAPSRAVARSSAESSRQGGADAEDTAPLVTARPQRLPRYYAQLELTQEQREQVLLIQQQYGQREAELERQLESLHAERDTKLKEVLTRSQQRKLNQLHEERGS